MPKGITDCMFRFCPRMVFRILRATNSRTRARGVESSTIRLKRRRMGLPAIAFKATLPPWLCAIK